ncbi:MAG: hypothetical protein HYX75_15505 [Acidobacteria bacterium]|nr:hypothetical protein [Acidobacteriota bacterium]
MNHRVRAEGAKVSSEDPYRGGRSRPATVPRKRISRLRNEVSDDRAPTLPPGASQNPAGQAEIITYKNPSAYSRSSSIKVYSYSGSSTTSNYLLRATW